MTEGKPRGVVDGAATADAAPFAAAMEGLESACDARRAGAEATEETARDLAERNALALAFDDVRAESREGRLVSPGRWVELGLVPDHLTDEDFEMLVFERWEDDERAREEAEAKTPRLLRAHTGRRRARWACLLLSDGRRTIPFPSPPRAWKAPPRRSRATRRRPPRRLNPPPLRRPMRPRRRRAYRTHRARAPSPMRAPLQPPMTRTPSQASTSPRVSSWSSSKGSGAWSRRGSSPSASSRRTGTCTSSRRTTYRGFARRRSPSGTRSSAIETCSVRARRLAPGGRRRVVENGRPTARRSDRA